jgi:hypothetical protein
VSKVEHHSKFTDVHYGYFRVYSVQHRLDVSTGEVSNIPAEEHKTSSQEIHKSTYPDFESYPELMHDVCTKVSGVFMKMLCRVAQSQRQTNLERMYVPQGIWEILATHMHQGFKYPSHPFFIDQMNNRVTKTHLQYVDEILELQTMVLEIDRATHYINRVKCYTREHLTFLQRCTFGCLFGFGARAKPTAPDDDELMGITAITYDMQVNVLTHLPFYATYGPPMMKYKQMGVDGVTFFV